MEGYLYRYEDYQACLDTSALLVGDLVLVPVAALLQDWVAAHRLHGQTRMIGDVLAFRCSSSFSSSSS